MKKLNVALLIGAIVFACAGCTLVNGYRVLVNRFKSKETLDKAYKLIACAEQETKQEENKEVNSKKDTDSAEKIDNNGLIEGELKKEVILEDDIIGVLVIPKIGINAPIRDGTSQEVLKTSIGHFIESDYWNGNVSLASHNGGTGAHYFENINKFNENDEIEYITKLGRKKYIIQKIYKISSYDWTSVISNGNNAFVNSITLVTCINVLPNYRLCVKAIEI